jgi:hypothetical protein
MPVAIITTNIEARAGFETIGPGLSVPRRATVRFARAPVDVVMDIELVEDHYEVVRLELTAHEGKITGTELRGIAVATLLRDGVRALLPFAAIALKPRTEPVPREELLDELAAVYLIARLAGEDPVKTCVEVFGRSRPTVASWITRARKDGLIK